MNSNQLKFIANKLQIQNFLGVFAVDELSLLPMGSCGSLIFNTDTSEKKGQHWIAICLTANKIFYFDSLNVNFLFTSEVTKFLLRNKKELFFNKIKTQVDNSNTCGIHCLVFCLYMSKLDVKEKSFITFFFQFITFQCFPKGINNDFDLLQHHISITLRRKVII